MRRGLTGIGGIRLRLLGLAAMGLVATGLLALGLAPSKAQDAPAPIGPLIIATGSINATDYRVAGAACEVVHEGADIFCAVAPTASGIAALRAAAAGEADFAILRADTYLTELAALEAEGVTDAPTPVMALHDDIVTLIGRNDLDSVEAKALVGKRINIGAPETVTRQLWMAAEAAIGADAARFPLRTELRAQEAGRALCEERIDGFLWLLSHPSGATRTILEDCDAQVLNLRGPGVEVLLSERPDLRRVVIPAETYGAALETETIGTPALLVAGPHVEAAAVAGLARTLLGNVEALASRHPSLARLDAASMIARGIPAPLNEAAAAAYRDMGLTY